jgi:hypothetical protein
VFRKITALWLICIVLVFAGAPAIACCSVTPTHDCCPAGQPFGGHDPRASAAELSACCTASVANAETGISTAEQHNVPKHPPLPDSLALVASVVLNAAVDTSLRANLSNRSSVYRPSYSTLYLSSGRLRL